MAFKNGAITAFDAVAFGKWLRGTRESQGLSKQELADKAQLRTNSLGEIENASRQRRGEYSTTIPSVELFARLAHGLGVELGYVLYKAGFEVGIHDVNMARLDRVEAVLSLLDERSPGMRKAMAEAANDLKGRAGSAELALAMADLDLITERLREQR